MSLKKQQQIIDALLVLVVVLYAVGFTFLIIGLVAGH